MFTKKHFEATARILKELSGEVEELPGGPERLTLKVAQAKLCNAFADEFRASNPRFDVDRFFEAAGKQES